MPFALGRGRAGLLVIDTRAPHRHADGEYADRRREPARRPPRRSGVPRCATSTDLDAALAALPDDVARRRVRHVVTENARVLATVAHAAGRAGPPRSGRC